MVRSAWHMMTLWQSWPAAPFPQRSLVIQCMALKDSKTVLENHRLPLITNLCMETRPLTTIYLKQSKRIVRIQQLKPWKISPIQGLITLSRARIIQLTKLIPSFSRPSSKVSTLAQAMSPIITFIREAIHPPTGWSPYATTPCGTAVKRCMKRPCHPTSPKFRSATLMSRDGAKSPPSTATFSMAYLM